MSILPTAPVAPVPPATSRIGRFYVTRELGRGSTATVYLGHDPIVDRDIAIKTFHANIAAAARKPTEQQLINEARAAGRLAHPHIVTIYEASSEGGTTYVAMEYLQGRELNKILNGGHRFSTDDVASIAWKIADALDHAHKNGVIHRDIKPANIFIVDDHQPKIVDFGIARAPNRIAEPSAHADQPVTLFRDNLLGTPNYMSPEQAMGRDVDSRTDIYSLGAVMYEMLTGRTPFHSKGTEQLLEMIAYKAPPAPHEIDPSIPMTLSQVTMRAMSKRPEKRYQQAEDMVLELKRYLTRERRARQRKPESSTVRGPAPGKPSGNRHAGLWILGCAASALLVVAYLLWRH